MRFYCLGTRTGRTKRKAWGNDARARTLADAMEVFGLSVSWPQAPAPCLCVNVMMMMRRGDGGKEGGRKKGGGSSDTYHGRAPTHATLSHGGGLVFGEACFCLAWLACCVGRRNGF